MGDPPADRSVAVCIATYRRPKGLRALLESLAGQVDIDLAHVRVVVVDNDPDGSAAAVIQWAAQHTPLDLVSDVEPRPGVSHARNRSIQLADGFPFIAVIDDDMTADPRWLASLLAAQERFDADVVGGRVERSIEDPARRWVIELDLFAPLTTGEEGATAHAIELGNSILRRSVLGDAPFDPSLGVIGGEDTKLFLTLARDGRRIVTTETARAHEVITPDRARLPWMMRRTFRLGSCWTMIERAVLGTTPMHRVARASARIGRGMITATIGLITLRRARVVNGILDGCEGVGMLAGVAGITLNEYGRDARRFVRVSRAELGPTDRGSGRGAAAHEAAPRD